MSNLSDSTRQGTSSVASATQLTIRQIDRSQQEMRLVVDEACSAKVYLLAALGDHDDARMVGSSARRGGGSPVEAYVGNLHYPILFLAHERCNLAREFYPQLACRVCFQSGVFRGLFHATPLQSAAKDIRLAAAMPAILCLTRGIGNE
jgi:hypothetical protein